MNTHAGAGPAATVVAVVGGSGGLGQAVCRCLAAEHYRVFITYRSGQRAAEQIAHSLPAGTSVGIGRMDVTDWPFKGLEEF